MNLDQRTQEALQALSDAINFTLEQSASVRHAIDRVRALGVEPVLPLRVEIGAQNLLDDAETPDTAELELTDEDVRTLRRMKIIL